MIDNKDLAILEALHKDARLSSQAVSRTTGIPITTVFHRIKRLEKLGVIQGYSVKIDKKKLGKVIRAYIHITVNYAALDKEDIGQDDLMHSIRKLKDVEEVSMVTGETDILVRVCTTSIDQLNEFVTKSLRKCAGVDKTRTAVVLNYAD